jgi:hypothetical protein
MSRFDSPDMQLIDLLRRSDHPSADDMQRVKKAIAVDLAVGMAATTALVASKTVWGAKLGTLATWAKGMLLVSSLVGVGIGVTLYAKPEGLLLGASRVTAPVASLGETTQVTTPALRSVEREHTEQYDSPKPALPQESEIKPRTSGSPKGARNGSSTLEAELELLGRSQRALKAGQPNEALRASDEHARKFPNGVLTLERLGVRTVALCQMGRLADGRAAAKSYLRMAPNSVLSKRIRIACQLSDE